MTARVESIFNILFIFLWIKLNFGRALENYDVYEEWKMIQQEW